jgi:transcriptional regulator with PAS, ATPase and Fis domain
MSEHGDHGDHSDRSWIEEFPAAVTVCDREGKILEMNAKAAKTFEKDGGMALIGSNMLACHPEPARSKVKAMLEAGQPNIYTIEKNGVKKLIYQSPWYENGLYCGFVELSMEIPVEMPHFKRT